MMFLAGLKAALNESGLYLAINSLGLLGTFNRVAVDRTHLLKRVEKGFTCCGNYYVLLPMIRSVYFQLRMLDICCVTIAGRIVPCNSLSVISKPWSIPCCHGCC